MFGTMLSRSVRVLIGCGLAGVLALCRPAHAVTRATIDGHPEPVTILSGETIALRFDVAKAGGTVQYSLVRDVLGTGRFDPADPWAGGFPETDGDGQDLDATDGKVGVMIPFRTALPAGRYVIYLLDSDGSNLSLPVALAPKPEPQSVSGRVAVVSKSQTNGGAPPDAVIWAYRDPKTPVASASIRPDGSYTLPLPAGVYILFAEWFGSLRSQRQYVTLGTSQQITGADLLLLQGQEVSGTISSGGSVMVDAVAKATDASGQPFATRSFADGSYTLVLPPGQYRITAPGGSESVTVTDQPVDGVDFPSPVAAPDPPVGSITTVAGNGVYGFGGDGRRATAARMALLEAIAIDLAGNLFLVDGTAVRIRKIDAATGIISTVVGSGSFDSIRGISPGSLTASSGDGGPATAARTTPDGLAIDLAGNLYVAEAFTNRVRTVNGATGIISTLAGAGGFGAENGAFTGDGGPANVARLNSPYGVAVDRSGNVFIADSLNGRVRKVTPDGKIQTVAGGGTKELIDGATATDVALSTPIGLATDAAGHLFISDIGLARVLKLTPAGTIQIIAGTGKAGLSGEGGPASSADQAFVLALAVDSAGNVFFSDAANQRVHKVSLDGKITTVAGSGPTGLGNGSFAGDGGAATAARLSNPFGLAIDARGNLFIADQGNSRIRKVVGVAAPGIF